MPEHRAWIKVEFYCDLPDDEFEADKAFEAIEDQIDAHLNAGTFAGVWEKSFSVSDGNTEAEV